MALFGAGADTLWSGASTWRLCDGVLRSDAQTFMAASGEQVTQVFTLTNAVDYDGIYLWPALRAASPSGTLTIRLLKAGVALQTVTINVSDLPPVGSAAILHMGPVFFKFGANVTGAGTNDYTVGIATSGASQVSFYRDATAANASRAVRRAAFSTPVAGDDFIICGERTGAGAMTNRTITYDVTATTDWGSASNSALAVAVAISAGGTLQSQLTAATNYYLKVSGRFHLYWDGRFDIGTSGSKLPTSSSFTLDFDATVNVDYGFAAYAQYTLNMAHSKGFTVAGNGDSNSWVRLTSNLAAGVGTGAGSIAVEDTTGWAVGDTLEFSTTRASGSGDDSLTVAAIASGTTLSTSANASFLHDGSATPRTPRATVANTKRGIIIKGASTTLQAFFNLAGGQSTAQTPQTPAVYMEGVEFAFMGSATTDKRGFELTAVGGTFEFNDCVFRNFEVASSSVRITYRDPGTTMLFRNCIFYRVSNDFALTAPSVAGNIGTNRIRVYHCLLQRNLTSQAMTINWPAFDIQRCVMSKPNSQGLSMAIAENWLQDGGNIFKDNEILLGANNGGLVGTGPYSGTMENLYIARSSGGNVNAAALSLGFSPTFGELVITGLKIEGGTSGVRGISLVRGYYRLVTPEITGDTLGNLPVGIAFAGAVNSNGGCQGGELIVEGGSILLTTTILQAELYSSCRVTLEGVTTTVAVDNVSFYNNPSRMADGYVQVLNHGNTAGENRVWVPNGRTTGPATFVPDTTRFSTASPSLAMYPGSATAKVKSPTFSVAVAQGQTATPSVKVRESVVGDGTDYNGNRARLIVKRNALAGIASDTVLDTATSASEGAWETLTGTTAAVSRDCVLEFYVDCDGTTGWLNIDDFECTSEDTRGMKYYSENKLSPWVVGGTTGGGTNKPQHPMLNTVIG